MEAGYAALLMAHYEVQRRFREIMRLVTFCAAIGEEDFATG